MIALSGVWLALGERPVLRDVSFDVQAGQTKVILGNSGSGKTTILRVILGLNRPDRGSIRVDGQEITELDERHLIRVRQNMAMVFQGSALFDSLTVHENVGYRLWEHGRLPDEAIEQTVRESLQFVGLADCVDKMPAELSGGMRKRVGIARALASGAKILLYDEPTGGLDPINACMINRLITKLRTKGITQVVVTHDLDTAYRVADRIVMIQRGRVIFDGTPDRLKQSDDPAIRGFIEPGSLTTDWETFCKAPNPVD